MNFNPLRLLVSALAGVLPTLPGFKPLTQFRGATNARPVVRHRPRGDDRGRWPLAKAARSYQVRYTNIFSRRREVKMLSAQAQHAMSNGNTALATHFARHAAAFPWF